MHLYLMDCFLLRSPFTTAPVLQETLLFPDLILFYATTTLQYLNKHTRGEKESEKKKEKITFSPLSAAQNLLTYLCGAPFPARFRVFCHRNNAACNFESVGFLGWQQRNTSHKWLVDIHVCQDILSHYLLLFCGLKVSKILDDLIV